MDKGGFEMYYIDMDMESLTLTIHSANRVACAPDWRWDSRRNNWSGYHLWTIAGGGGRFETPEGSPRCGGATVSCST